MYSLHFKELVAVANNLDTLQKMFSNVVNELSDIYEIESGETTFNDSILNRLEKGYIVEFPLKFTRYNGDTEIRYLYLHKLFVVNESNVDIESKSFTQAIHQIL